MSSNHLIGIRIMNPGSGFFMPLHEQLEFYIYLHCTHTNKLGDAIAISNLKL